MRKISGAQILVFAAMLITILLCGAAATALCAHWLPPSDFRGVVTLLIAVPIFYLVAFAVYRVFLHAIPLQEGELIEGSRGEFAAQVNILFYLVFFNSLIRTHALPVPLMRLVYQALGARLGTNTYSAGTLLDPPLTSLGDNCIVGHNAVVFAHAIEGPHMALSRVQIGDNVTIGAMAIVMAGVTIDDNAIVSAGAVVRKDTHIGPGEIWGGVPAKRLGHRKDVAATMAMHHETETSP